MDTIIDEEKLNEYEIDARDAILFTGDLLNKLFADC